jgi:two-component system sensor kinase FixL
VFETTHDLIFTADDHGVLNGVNRVPAGLTLDQTIGAPMLAFAAPEEQEPMRARYEEVRRTGKLVAYETVAMYPDGRKESYASRMGPILDGDRSVGVVLITRNVTQERQAEEAKRYAEQQLRDYMQQLERSNRELERFASVASHDLQEPLRKIQAFSDRLRDKYQAELAETGRDYLERIRSAAKRMQDLINDLLMFSRISAKEQSYSRVNLTKVAKSVLSDLEVRVEETEAEVTIGDLPTIDADPVHMRQLLQNMIGNALKFTRAEVRPTVEVTAEPASPSELGPDDPEMVKIHVRDNGIGIEPRHHERIFSIFERLHGRGKYEGTGVGLAVCRKIVEQHRGYIKLASVPGEGTTFTIFLPLRQPERNERT